MKIYKKKTLQVITPLKQKNGIITHQGSYNIDKINTGRHHSLTPMLLIPPAAKADHKHSTASNFFNHKVSGSQIPESPSKQKSQSRDIKVRDQFPSVMAKI